MEEPRRFVPKPQPYPAYHLRSKEIEDELKVTATSGLESRAATIRLSNIPIVNQHKGRVRVARESPAGERGTERTSPNHQTPPLRLSKTQATLPTKDVDISGLKSLAPNVRISHFQKSGYEYKPPAAAKYFLWDSTLIGGKILLTGRSLVPEKIEITDAAQKSLSILLMKRELLLNAQSTTIQSCLCGYFLGKMVMVVEGEARKIIVDRFEATKEEPKGAVKGDIVIKVFDANAPLYANEEYEYTLSIFKQSLDSNPTEQLDVSFPLSCHVSSKDNVMMRLVERMLVPNYELEVFPIHPLRIVFTELTHSLSSGNHKSNFGFVSIDQARQLYLLSDSDPKMYSIPLIGVWCNGLEDMSDPKLHSLLVRFITNTKICKLDTGKNQLLICHFSKENSSRPECYQCNFKVFLVHLGSSMYESDSISQGEFLDVHIETDLKFCKTWNSLFEQKIPVSEPEKDDVPDHVIQDEKDEPDFGESTIDLQEEDEHEEVKTEIEDQVPMAIPSPSIQLPTANANLSSPPFIPPPQSTPQYQPQDPMTFMYVSMLQQQITALQTQLLSKPQPSIDPIPKKETKSVGVNTDPIPKKCTTTIGCNTESIVGVEMGVNTEDDVTPRPSPRILPSDSVAPNLESMEKSPLESKLTSDLTREIESKLQSGLQNGSLESKETPFVVDTGMKSAQRESSSELESRLESMKQVSLPIPTDNGSNFKALYDFEDPSKPPSIYSDTESDISFAQKVIPQLVSNAEQSFVYHEVEPESMGPLLFNSRLQKEPETRSSLNLKEPESLNWNTRNVQPYTKEEEMKSVLETTRDLSYSFDTLEYLKRYGLS